MAKKKNKIPEKRKEFLKANWKTAKPKTDIERTYLAKVKGGHTRSEQGIKDARGKYLTTVMYKEIVRDLAAQKGTPTRDKKNRIRETGDIIKAAKISSKELKTFYEINRETFDRMIETGSVQGMPKNSNQLESLIDDYKGKKIFIDTGKSKKAVNKAEAKYSLIHFKQFLSETMNVVDFTITPEMSFRGEMSLRIPDPEDLTENVMERLGIDSYDDFDEYTGPEIMKALSDTFEDTDYYDGWDDYITVYAS